MRVRAVKFKFNKKTNTVTVYISNLAPNALVKIKYKIVRKMNKDIRNYSGLCLVKKSTIKTLKPDTVISRKGFIYKNYGKSNASKSLSFNLGKTILNYVKKSKRVSSTVKNNQVRFKIKKSHLMVEHC